MIKTNRFWKAFITLSLIIFANKNEAKLLQILHTNDTHSYLDNATHSTTNGGSARLKSLIDFYKEKMNEENVPTLVMDAGDFTEGNIYIMAEQGKKVFQIHNEVGYDVGAIGNHDYLVGSPDLDKILGEIDFKMSFVTANIEMSNKYKNIKEKIIPFKEYKINGVKLAVLGLTTNEIFYKWRLDGGKITNPYKSAKKYEKILKKRNNDFIIALTHIGVLNDIKLAERSKDLDLIVGGHSHTTLFKPIFGVNKLKKSVPIVQAGLHTKYLGRLIIDIEKGKPLKVVKYELVPVKYESADFKVKAMVEEADNDLDNIYGKDFLDTVIGKSDLSEKDESGSRKWAYYITDAIKEKANADVAIHTPYMNGENFPVGNVTRRDLYNSIPRVFDLRDKFGWSIYTTKIKGIWLRVVFETLTHFGNPLTFSGLKMEKEGGKLGVFKNDYYINGKKLVPTKNYTVAFTEGVVKGASAVSNLTLKVLKTPKDTNEKIWLTLEEKIKKNSNKLNLKDISDENHVLIMPDANAELPE